jgi:hypothetical protein
VIRPTEERTLAAASMLPEKRPCTRKEAWDYESFLWADLKTHEELVARARERWVWSYVSWFNFKRWRKQPDWTEGDAVIEAAVPTKPFFPDQRGWAETVYDCLARAREPERRAA